MADQVKVSIDTRAGRASLVYGRLFVGGVYDLQVETEGQADTTRLVRIYRFDVARRIKWALAEAKGGGQLFLDSEDFRKAFLTVAPSRALPCEFIVYDDDAIVAQGNVVVEWSPTLTTVDGTPVDVQGPVGEKGDKGDKGDPGEDGKDGKSAYKGAVEQGYQGTEAQFYKNLGGLTKAIETANEAARDAENAKSGAENAKGVADESATAAARSASAASSSAQGAAQSASAAASAAKSASESVQAIQTTVQSVAGAVSTAQAAAKDAEAAKRGAETAKQGATTAAGNADASAKVAKEQASKAQEGAQAAAKDAERVSGVVGGVKAQVDRLVQTAQEAKETIGDLASGAALSAEASASSAEAAAKYADEVVDAKGAAEQKAKEAGSANSSAQSAKTAAEAAQKAAEAAKADAEQAKTGAEAAKDGAESAKTGAEAAAGQAASSATNAAQSATAAQEAAQGLQEGLATLNTLDGRVTFLESGEGVYKDPSTGKVKTYKPLPGSDGTVKITKELPQFYKILPVEEDYATSRNNIAVSDGVYYVFYCGVYSACRIYFYSSSMKRLGKIPNSDRDLELFDSGRIALFTASDGHLRASGTYTSIYGNSSAMLWDVTAGEMLKIVGIKAINSNNDGMDTIYNPASGHILTREAAVKREDDATRYDFSFLVWDEDLNPVLDETTGVQKRIDANGVFYDNSYPAEEKVGKLFRGWQVKVFQAPFDNKVYFTSTNYRGAANAGLFTFGVDDTPVQIMEHIPVEDPDNPGYCLCEKNEDGSLKREWEDRNCFFPRLITQEVGPAIFIREYPEAYGLSAGGNGNGFSGPAFLCSMTGYNQTVKEYKSCFRDLAFRYIVTPDNKLINTVFFNNEFLTEAKAPRYTYEMPIPNAAEIGNKPWPGSPHNAMLIPHTSEATAMMFPYTKDETRMIAVKGTVVYDNANPFNPIDKQKYPFFPVEINPHKEGRSASPNVDNAYVVFGDSMWCTTYNLAYAGILI